MRVIDFRQIQELNISPEDCIQWVEEALALKHESILPAKISIKMDENVFFNTMPCFIPSIGRIGIKLVSRYPKREPSLKSDLLLYDSGNGDTLALMNADWITAMRTGAVAAVSIKTLQSSNATIYSFVGLGNTARATLLCLLCANPQKQYHIRLLRYKDHADDFINRFIAFKNVSFEIIDTHTALVDNADVIVSCVTALDNLFAPEQYFKEGVLVVPIHTRGFQNCDLFFDKVFGDDTDHIKDFKYFTKFKSFVEFPEVLAGKNEGRTNDKERILIYNIGIALHDIYFAAKIYSLVTSSKTSEITLDSSGLKKFWI